MRIISSKKDYYDSASSYGIDPTCIYNRDKKEYPIKEIRELNWTSLNTRKIVIGFAGNFYPLTQVTEYKVGQANLELFFYNLKEYEEYYEKNYQWDTRGYSYKRDRKEMIDFYNANNWKKYETLFFKYKVPIFSLYVKGRETVVEVNSILKNIEFFRIKDAASAFQEIFSYLSGVIGVEKNIPLKIEDKVRAGQRGFDKMSFRRYHSIKGMKKRPKE